MAPSDERRELVFSSVKNWRERKVHFRGSKGWGASPPGWPGRRRGWVPQTCRFLDEKIILGSFQSILAAYMARASARIFLSSTLQLDLSRATADSERSSRGISCFFTSTFLSTTFLRIKECWRCPCSLWSAHLLGRQGDRRLWEVKLRESLATLAKEPAPACCCRSPKKTPSRGSSWGAKAGEPSWGDWSGAKKSSWCAWGLAWLSSSRRPSKETSSSSSSSWSPPGRQDRPGLTPSWRVIAKLPHNFLLDWHPLPAADVASKPPNPNAAGFDSSNFLFFSLLLFFFSIFGQLITQELQ